jgi:hypothetical protein
MLGRCEALTECGEVPLAYRGFFAKARDQVLLAVLQVIQVVDVVIQGVDVAPLGGHLRAQPPKLLCDDEEGMLSRHVRRFQKMPPRSPARMIAGVIASGSTMSLAIVAATFSEMKAPMKLQGPRRDRGRHRVGGVVKPVREIERQRGQDDENQDDVVGFHVRTVPGSAHRAPAFTERSRFALAFTSQALRA